MTGKATFGDRCPTRLKDYLRQQTRMGSRRPTLPISSKTRHPLPRSSLTSPRRVRFAEAANTLPTVAESYGRCRIAALEGEDDSPWAVDDSWDDVDLTMYDEATVAALYEELQEEEDPDFLEGQ